MIDVINIWGSAILGAAGHRRDGAFSTQTAHGVRASAPAGADRTTLRARRTPLTGDDPADQVRNGGAIAQTAFQRT